MTAPPQFFYDALAQAWLPDTPDRHRDCAARHRALAELHELYADFGGSHAARALGAVPEAPFVLHRTAWGPAPVPCVPERPP